MASLRIAHRRGSNGATLSRCSADLKAVSVGGMERAPGLSLGGTDCRVSGGSGQLRPMGVLAQNTRILSAAHPQQNNPAPQQVAEPVLPRRITQ